MRAGARRQEPHSTARLRARQAPPALAGATLKGWAPAPPTRTAPSDGAEKAAVIRKLASGKYRLYSRTLDPKTGRRRNLGTFASRAAAERQERAVQFFKRRG